MFIIRVTLAVALAAPLAAFAAPSTAHADVRALDAWGRYVTAFDLHAKEGARAMSYVPNGTFMFLVDGAASDDVVLAQYYVGKQKLGDELKCPVRLNDVADSEQKVAIAMRCAPDLDAHGLSKPAKIRVEVGYRQLARGKDHPRLATYEFAVAKHVGPGKRTEFHIEHDFRMGESWLHFMGDGRGVHLYTWFKTSHDRSTHVNRSTVKMRCFVGDKTLDFNDLTNSRWDYEWDDYRGGESDKTAFQFNYFFPPGDPRQFLRDNPGDYRCVLTRGGEIDRELHFTIGADGMPVKPACQQGDAPLVSAPPTTTLVKTVWKSPQDREFDRGAFAKGALYGRAGVPEACGF